MNPTKRPPGASSIPQPFKRQAGHTPHVEPVGARPGAGAPVSCSKRPCAPTAFRPMAPPPVQPKMPVGTLNRKPPSAPPAYRPQPTPKVLQAKSSLAQSQATGQARPWPSAPPVYRPQAKPASVQAKPSGSIQTRNQPPAPPVYRPQTPPRVLQTKTAAGQRPGRIVAPAARPLSAVQRKIGPPAPLPTGSVIQRSKDGDWIPPWEQKKKKQLRFGFREATPENVIRATAHRAVHFDQTRYNAVFTCRNCKIMLAYEDKSGDFHLTDYVFISKSKKKHTQRALSIDHHPDPWAERLAVHKKKKSTDDVMRKDYQDESKLRALCKVCNESHALEGVDLDDYDSDSSDDGFDPERTPKHETQYNSGSWSGYREPTWLSKYT